MVSRRRRRGAALLGLVGIVVLAAGCGNGAEETAPSGEASDQASDQASEEDGPGSGTTEQVRLDGQTRTYRLLVPDTADASAPVVVVLHDAGGSPESIAEATQFNRAAREHGFAVAYPASVSGTWNAGFCCGDAPAEGIDDMAFLDQLLEEFDGKERIDGQRVYVAGVSNGAIMGYRYACQGETPLAGVASVAGAMAFEECEPAAPVSVLEIHGTGDDVVPVEGGELADFTRATRPVPSAEETAERWADLNGCGESSVDTDEPVTTTTWSGCREEAAVRLIVIEGAGHTWYAPGFGEANGAVDATAAVVDFFGLGQSE